jgi:7-keto-8-aminopelargonate synthetase-like enzyme
LSGATLRVFPHNHLGKLESHLDWARRQHPESRVLIATESVFSMDGDRAPLRELIELKKRFGALLMLDEAHAIGVVGPNGRGVAAGEQLSRYVEIQMGTLSKALGVSGGYICGSRSLIEWLINRARSFIFTTAPPPALAAAALAAIEFVASEGGEQRRQLLWNQLKTLREFLPPSPQSRLVEMAGDDGSAIHPWIVGEEQMSIDLSRALQTENFLVPAIRYPTVAKGSARLRITVTADHEDAQIRALCQAITRLRL